MAAYMRKRRAKRREEARLRLGGKCVVCGSTEKLEFDHVDPSTKVLNVSSAKCLDGPRDRLLEEVDKCQLLCKLHHREKSRLNGDLSGGGHNKLPVKHGTASLYNQKCRCDHCKEWKRKYRNGLVDSRGENLSGELP